MLGPVFAEGSQGRVDGQPLRKRQPLPMEKGPGVQGA